MQMDFDDLYLINAINARNTARERAKNIQDNFGVQLMELEDYRKQKGGLGFGNALITGIVVGAALALGGMALLPLIIGQILSMGTVATLEQRDVFLPAK